MNKIIPDYDLSNLRVLVTRPGASGLSLCAEINKQQGQAIHFPTIEFLPPSHPQQFQEQVFRVDEQDWLIFISPQAVVSASYKIHQFWPQFPWQVKVAALGAGTAKALQKASLPVDVFPDTTWNSWGLLRLPQFQHVSGKKIMIVRGEGGRTELADKLKQRGAIVTHMIAYQRSLPQVDVSDCLGLLRAQAVDVVITASGEGLENLKELLKPGWPTLQFVPVVVISQRMADIAKELGFRKILTAKNASHHAILEMLNLIC